MVTKYYFSQKNRGQKCKNHKSFLHTATTKSYCLLWLCLGFICSFFYNFSSQTPLNIGPQCSSNEPIDILRDGVKVDGNEDFESEDLVIQFDFNSIKTVKNQIKDEKDNPLMSFEGSVLLHKKSKEILIEPLVETYLNLKWQSLKGWWYGYRILFFIAFGVCLTLMMSFIVEMNNHCKYERNNITSGKYWTFSDPPNLYVSINTSKTELNTKVEGKLVERKVLSMLFQ